MDTGKGMLCREWLLRGKIYRLIAVGRHRNGYKDVYHLQVNEKDEMGGDRWGNIRIVDKNDGDPTDWLTMELLDGADVKMTSGSRSYGDE